MDNIPLSGLLLIDKPSGPTSHDIVDSVRKGAGIRRIGHAGTLDPLATGLLVMLVGPAARLSEYVMQKDKRYLARVRFGQSTNTYDAAGRVGAESRTIPDQDAVERALPRFHGTFMQMPPAFSAIKRGGQKAYELARQGEAVEMEPREVTVHSLELTKWEPPFCMLDIQCSAGTYIRSIAHDLGQALKCGAHITALRRTASGIFRIEEAVTLADLQKAFASGEWRRYLLPPDAGLADWPEVNLDAKQTKSIWNGNPIALGDADPASEWGRAYNPEGDFIAIIRADLTTRQWKPHKVMSM